MINKSEELFLKSKTCIPGGVNSPVRAFQAVKKTPVFIQRAKGSKIYDVDQNEYIDYICSWGPCILGHAEPSVIEAVQQAASNGLTFGAPTEREYELANLIHEAIPSMEMTRLVSSGTEAVMSAIRLARAYSNKDMIIKFEGCYHGHSDGMLVKAGSGALTQAVPDSKGVPQSYTNHTLIAQYNDISSVEALFHLYPDQIAAIIVEPVAANMGVVLPNPGFLEFLRDITRKHNSLLIFDEVITGLRLGLSGAQGYYQITPDLTTLGKIVGGGMPVGAYGGRTEIMQMVAPIGPVYQAGTLSGNPISTAAGIATIKILRDQPEIYASIETKASTIALALKERFQDRVQVNQIGSLLCAFFTSQAVVNFQSAMSSDTTKFTKYFNYMFNNGLYIAPSQYEAMFLSYAHSEEDIKKTCEIIRNCPEF